MKKFFSLCICLGALLGGTAHAAELHFKGKVTYVEGQRAIGYWGICTLDAPVMIEPGAELVYEMNLDKSSIWGQGGIDLTGGTVNNLRDNGKIVDADNKGVRGWAAVRGQWFERRFKLDAAAGKTFQNVDFMSGEIEAKKPGIYAARVRNLRLEIPGKKPLPFAFSEKHTANKFRNFEALVPVTGAAAPDVLELSCSVIVPASPDVRSWGYWGIAKFATPVAIEADSELVYELFVVPGSIANSGGVDLTGGTVNNLRDNGKIVDARNRDARNRAGIPAGAWVERRFKLNPVAGKTFTKVDFFSAELEKAPAGSYNVRLRNIRIETPGKEPQKIQPTDDKEKDRFSNMTTAAAAAAAAAYRPPVAGLAPGEFRLTSRCAVRGVHDFVMVAVTPPGWGFTLPDKSFLSYDVRLLPDSVSDFAGINLMFDGQDLRYRYNRESEIITNVSAFRGKWGARKIDLSRMANRRIYEAYAVAGFHQMVPGKIGAEFRNVRIEDENGKTICTLSPGAQTPLYYPIQHHAKFVTDVLLEIPEASGGRFRPSKYLTDDNTPLSGTLYLHNFDPAQTQTLHYNLQVGGKTIAQNTVELPPNGSFEAKTALGKLPVGDYSPLLTINGKTIKEFAISIRTTEELKQRKRAWEPGASAIGIVPMTAAGAGGIWNIPAMRELGGNYYQCRIDWSTIEVAPGKYDFKWFWPYLEMANDCGVDVQMDFYSGYPSYSVPEVYRQFEMLLNDGSRHGGTCSPIAYWSPGFAAGLKAMQGFYAEAIKHPSVLSYNAWTGGSMDSYYGLLSGRERKNIMDYSPWALEKYREFVKNVLKYSVSDVNAKYGLSIKSFDELELPQPRRGELDLRLYWYDFMRYRSWSVNEMQNQSSQALRSIAPKAEIEYLYGGGLMAARQSNDYNQGLLNAIKHDGSIHHTAAPGAVDLMFLGALTRNFGVPFSIETAGTPATMPEHQWAMFELLRESAAGFTWISSPGLTYRPPATYAAAEYRQAFDRLRDARPLACAIALIAGTSQQKTDIFNESPEVRTALQQLRELARHLEAAGYEVDVFTDETPNVDFSKYPLVIEPGNVALTRECADALTAYVRSGGKLLALNRSGKYTPGAPEERSRFLSSLKNSGKGKVCILDAFPSIKKSASANFRQLASRFHNGVYPSELDSLLVSFAGVTPRILTGEDNIYLALRKHGDRYFVILFNNSDRLREFPFSPEIPAGNYFVYDLVRRHAGKVGGFSKGAHARLMPYEIVVEEWSKTPVKPPLYDAPAPRRRYVAPEKSGFGHRLASWFTPAGIPEDHPDFAVLPIQVAPGAKFRPPVPGPGSYELNLASIGHGAKTVEFVLAGQTHVLKEVTRHGDFAIYSSRGTPLRLAPGDALTFGSGEPLKIVYTELVPDFVPIEKLTVGPGRPNPGAYNGPEFRAPLPGFSAVAGRTLDGVKGLFDFSCLGVHGAGVTEVAWEVDVPEDTPSLLALGADFGLRLQLNGTEIFDSTASLSRQAAYPREFQLPIQLKKGKNQFVGRITSGNNGWRFWCEIMRSNAGR